MTQQYSEQELTNQIYDIYVIRKSGIPLFAGCTVTEYCKNHMGQHELISGFFSAMFSFSEESFKDDNLETMIYGDIILNFWKDEEHDLIFVFIHDRKSDIKKIRSDLIRAHDIFIDEYGEELERFSVDQSVFEDYRDKLRDQGIIPHDLTDTSGMMKVEEKHKDTRPRLVRWITGLFN